MSKSQLSCFPSRAGYFCVTPEPVIFSPSLGDSRHVLCCKAMHAPPSFYCLSVYFKNSFIVCIAVLCCVCHTIHVEIRSHLTMWVPGITSKLSGLAASTSTYWDISGLRSYFLMDQYTKSQRVRSETCLIGSQLKDSWVLRIPFPSSPSPRKTHRMIALLPHDPEHFLHPQGTCVQMPLTGWLCLVLFASGLPAVSSVIASV